MATLRRRPAVAAALFYAIVVIVFLGPGLLPGKALSSGDTLWFEPPWLPYKPAELTRPSNGELGDSTEHLQLFLRATAEEFPDVQLWNPHIAGGRPFLANLQSSVFSPFSLPAYVLPFATALGWIGVMKLWVAAFGTFLLARAAFGMRFGGALLAGLVFALNLKAVTWVIYPNLGVWALIPWLLLFTDRLVRRTDLLAGAGLAAVIGLQFLAGHPESSFHALLAAGAFLALRLWQARTLWRPLLAFCAALAGGLALAAVSLIPFAELLSLSADVRDRAGESIDVHLEAKEVLGLFLPDYWGRPTQTPIRPILLERAMYVGALPLMLAVAALILRRNAERVAVALFGALWFAVVIGIPPVVQIVTRIPPFSSGHNTRLIILTILALALLAGWGLDDLTDARRLPAARRRAALAAAAGLLLVPLAYVVLGRRASFGDIREGLEVALLFADPPGGLDNPVGEGVIRAASLFSWLTFAGIGVLLVGLRLRERLAPAPFVALAVLLVCADLFHIGMGYNPAVDKRYASVPETPAIRFLERQNPARFVSREEVAQNVIPMRFGLYEAKGYDLPILSRYDRFWRRQVVQGNVALGLLDIPLRFLEPTPSALRAMRLLGVTHVMEGKAVQVGEPPDERVLRFDPLDEPGLTEVYDGPDARLYGVEGALPRAFVVGGQQVVDGEDAALDAITRPDFDARRVAVTEERLDGLPESGPAGEAEIVRYGPERVTIRASSEGPGLLVLSDNHYPGWKATVDGEPADVERVDYLFRGVRLGPGAHTVEFRYEPLSFRIGWIVSLLALVGLVAAIAVGKRRRRAPMAIRSAPE
jgi:hypothetical protein